MTAVLLVYIAASEAARRPAASRESHRIDRDAEARRGPQLHGVDLERLRKPLADPVDHGLDELRRFLDIEVGKQDHELVAADPRHDVGVAGTGPQAAGHLDEQPVAVGVPERVVDVLEAIEVDAEDGDGEPAAARARERELELLVEQPPVGKLGQLVGRREHGQALVRLLETPFDVLQVGDVGHRRGDSEQAGRRRHGVVAHEVPETLRVRDLDPAHGFARLEHRASERFENVSVHRRQLSQRAAFDLVALVAHDLGERLVDANVPKIVVEEPEAGGRVDEERVEKRALALRVLGRPREPVAQADAWRRRPRRASRHRGSRSGPPPPADAPGRAPGPRERPTTRSWTSACLRLK